MIEIIWTVLALIGGITLGVLFFGGLWFTVKIAFKSNIPALWFFGSLLLRITLTMLGFYFIGSGNWRLLVSCGVGFILARFLAVHFTKTYENKQLKEVLTHEA